MNPDHDSLDLGALPWGGDPAACIVGLAARIGRRFRREAPGAALADSRIDDAIADSRHVVLLLFDGLGDRQVRTLIPGGAIADCRGGALRSVFPSSTAPAITSFATATFPAAHANPGWFCWNDAQRAVVRTLPMDLRGAPDQPVAPETIWDWRSASLDFGLPVVSIQPDFIADSAFSRHAWAGARRVGYRTADDLVAAVEQAVRGHPDGGFVWAYLPQFDSVSHERGWQSEPAADVARRFDLLFERLAGRLRDTGALLLATADHGFVDVPASQQLRLDDFPELAALLERPLTGEPRVVYCKARAGHEEAFEEAARATLGFAFHVLPSPALVDAGWFGPGPASHRLAGRIGSHTLVGRDRYTLVDRVPGEPEPAFVGMHGGIHPDELAVPLAAVRRGAPP